MVVYILAEKQRVIQEYVPGKQVTMAHIIPNPQGDIHERLGIVTTGAIGIMTITPSEAAIIAADAASKAGDIELGFLDRFTGSLVITGDVSSVEAAIRAAVNTLVNILGFSSTEVTRS
ncbi:BMC domain-containing protein [Desulfosporosinus sp. BICA1-9]|uniref:BMC domain-containing protein n=1 Tax=Desulfosporosinus sp. BICA1-9 TaxID=1531958 RepID=UPI00054BE061|nr:BMC domain-containing protein [Desulfosporosinus sp. BICA1-9]KJS49294.1 MAG: carboxysome shell protein [Peptococcaceae bacterium BRH_c23]KJS81203.1 MAG: carboxysome shell protein [Desulfosporosinus sp. BICA1-9]HBW37526.1 BMC domain-containing protein [Desulfosporosinus sp.]